MNELHSAMDSQSLRLRGPEGSRDGNEMSRNTTKNTHLGRLTRKQKARKQAQAKEALRWQIPLFLTTALSFLYLLSPTETNIAYPLIFLSYKTLNTTDAFAAPEYGKGPRDIAFVGFYALVLFFAREFITQKILRSLAVYLGITSRSKIARFNEQAFVALYTGIVGPLGLYVMYHSPTWYFSTAGMYAAYPHKTHLAVTKFYYLFQAAFWVQQAMVMILGLETRRRDFRELVVHHIVTVSLIALSYRFHFTMMGVLVYVTHDISDFFLATSKALNYIDSPLQGPYFTLCIIFWIYLRHYINLKILYSILTEFRTIGPYVLDWEAEQYKSGISNVITFALLASLQALNLYWLYCLFRNAYRFVVLGVAKDDREDDVDNEK
ncbi:TLC domain-containing protein [Xylaria bambusicola]|uniref:TLC domain-containing protein n=1 Tax=Xylaria bambusicola TaxID=326684 RepID=UPI00200874A8|nr:TLC domain-containing protein [Xylaria bambusicola]KAI0526200.1 TLC domain-containing protein [Xylaria bambusicola]